MAMKKAASNGSDRGAKMKADNAQKKSQVKVASNLKKPVTKTNSFGEQTMSKKEYNSRSGDLSGYGFNAVGRTLQRSYDQSKRSNKKAAAAQAQSSRVNRAEGASRIKVGKTKK